ncbi:MAG: DUF115 domain-containing protein [Treponema sp.]|nr:DUF115 domain-containing protein [Treponema sp.]
MRYIDSLNLNSSTKYFILIEPGLGYIIPVLQERFKESKIIVLHIESRANLTAAHRDSNTAFLYNTESADTQAFLEENIPETAAEEIKIIEWRPSLNYYKQAYVKLLSLVVDFIKRQDAVKRTTAAFGRKWVKNFFRNLENLYTPLLYRQTAIPVIVTGSGPSLENALKIINEAQDTCLIIAASSSVMALANTQADIIIATDGGSWALRHMYPLYRNNSGNKIAANLCAALPSQIAGNPLLIINDGSFWQSIILHELALPSVVIAQRGTVAATAIELALLLTSGNIYLAGMDFSIDGIRTHARPYAFDSIFFNRANRFLPFYSESFTRSSLVKKGGSLDIYSSWFKNRLSEWPKRIFAVKGCNDIFKYGILSKHTGYEKKTGILKPADIKSASSQFCKRGAAALICALNNPQYSHNIKHELASLLFPDENKVTVKMLETEINKIAYTR